MGRVYTVEPKDGERSGVDTKCFVAGLPIPGVFRVEFDDDTDEGFATVHAYFNIADKSPWQAVVDVTGEAAITCTFRHYVYLAHKDKIDAEAVHRNGFKHLPQAKAA